MDIQGYWKAVLKQDAAALRQYFAPVACVRWHNTDEQFTAEEFIRANCEYPGEWDGRVERVEEAGDLLMTVTHVYAVGKSISLHVASFIRVEDGLIRSIDEYWGDDGPAPQWRREMKIGRPIQRNIDG